MHHNNTCLIDSGKFTVNIAFGGVAHPFHFHIKQLWIVATIIQNDAVEKKKHTRCFNCQFKGWSQKLQRAGYGTVYKC